MKTCEGCHWWVRVGEGEQRGLCYRMPPVRSQMGQSGFMVARPEIRATERACGEHKERLPEEVIETKVKVNPPIRGDRLRK